jgi:hypothetical protein
MTIDPPQTFVQQIGSEPQQFLEVVRQVSETTGTDFFPCF